MTHQEAVQKLNELKKIADALFARIQSDIDETNDATGGNFGIGYEVAMNDTIEAMENLKNTWQ